MKARHFDAGFSAVELLITLFIAATFIAASYQLYTVVTQGGAEARYRAKASNIAYDNLRRYSSQATTNCSIVTPSPTPTIPSGSGLPAPSITITFSCPFGLGNTTSKISVSVRYGSPQQEVIHAILVTK